MSATAAPRRAGTWSFRLVVVRYYRRVYRLAAALLNDPAEAEDVTQETFTRFWQRSATIEEPQRWLLRVAHNACLDRLRRAGRLISDTDVAVPEPQDHDDPAQQYERAVQAAALRRHIDALPEPQRSLIVLFDIRGVSGAECAQILGLSENQVKVYLHRARRKLRVRMENADD